MSDILKGLNQAQREAVEHIGTPLLLLAGAGSGKTRVLTHRAANLIISGQATTSQILLLTFTNKAASEMKERMQHLLGSVGKKNNLEVFAGTFHSFCCRILRKDGSHLGIRPDFVIYDSDDQETLIKNILKDLNLTPQEFKPSSVMYFIEDCKNKYISAVDAGNIQPGFWGKQAAKIYKLYQQKLSDYQALDFNDLLFQTVRLFSEFPEVLDKYQDIYRHILVDEYQDTNQIQYLLTRLLSSKYRQVTAVGDASQAIYGWRGANYQNLTNFTVDFSDTKVVSLEENYRSTQIILDAANTVISKNNSHPILKLFTSRKSSDLIKLFEADSEVSEADYIAQKICFIYENLKVPYKQIAVLYRMNAQSRVLEEAFLKYSIPYVLIGGLRFYDRSEVKDVIAMLRVARNHDDHLSSERTQKALGKRKKILLDQHLLETDISDLTSAQILESVLNFSGYLSKYDPQDEDDQRRIENIKELKSVATTFPSLNDFLENIALVQQEYSIQEKNKKKDSKEGVRLMTLHSSKGLEFEAVFLVGFEEGILPHSRSMIDDSDIEEERRLCYVGITRAKDYLYISYATRRLFFGKSSLNEPSRFLLDIPQDLIEFDQPRDIVRDHRPKSKNSSELVYDPDIY
ncbi:UvrD-helicase domain-containing protein [Candidatus Shapirobacteria bacterium]|nr:UvrD-helicase domain-containing protein [Candidatus Shapirobacteria bacterium]